eukprot:TRINITY_DN4131_c0_g1_i1.p1 TRINITY_DN4131_c0_g1~~TRINITY_DN4131_c0_g1_i1.p1  ORF type:complete len:416 (+),score=35.81 TRINITY_DN4131_c0_g1_i1:189-1436(+)
MIASIQDKLQRISLSSILLVGLVVRLGLLVFGEWQDNNMAVKYTDVDYLVFTDAARYLAQGESPYLRSTYRYTPLLAWILTPNIWFHPVWGKLLFTLSDIIIAVLIAKIISQRAPNVSISKRNLFVCFWIFNPFSINVSTRGNAEALVSLLVLLCLYYLFNKKYILSGFFFGLSVHFKIYPIIYSLPMFLFIDGVENNRKSILAPLSQTRKTLPSRFFTKDRMVFFVVSASTFLILTSLMYKVYGYIFLYETYLYHVVRADNRHNFSVYFYYIYLNSSGLSTLSPFITGLLSFVPQMSLLLALSFVFFDSLELCLLLETITFVAFNKVCTVQYFIWYFSLLPLVLPFSSITVKKGVALFALWFSPQALWLYQAYRLEFLGENTFLEIWMAGILFFIAYIVILIQFISSHDSKISK